MNTPERAFYYHYKHDPTGSENNYAYEVMGVGHHTEEDARPEDAHLVVYRPLYDTAFVYTHGKMFDVRPLEMFMEMVPKGENDAMIPRFTKIEDVALIARLKAIQEEMYPKTDFD
ncbi:MAG: hypothetical protein JWN49_672 [Parcubacteria group bacterium]|nr:hypothetical protein [Parcubacteria group bacterium]